MRPGIGTTFALLLTLAVVSPAVAQSAPAQQKDKPHAELAIGYSYIHRNPPSGGCGCFNLNGGNATFAWPLKSGTFVLVGDVTAAHAGAISSSSNSLTLSTFTVGARYLPRLGHSSLQPFG